MTDQFNNIRESVHMNLLAVQRLFPGSGITVWNVWETPIIWWRQYVLAVDQIMSGR